MAVRLRLAALVAALLIPTLLLGRWMAAAGDALETPASLLPGALDGWTAAREETLPDDVLELIEPDAYLMRLYRAEGRTPLWLYVGVYSGRAGSGKSAHVPEACYPAQGWEVLGSEEVALPLQGGETLRVRRLDFHKDAARETVLYWFQPARRWPVGGAGEQLLRMWDAARGHPQYAFVRISGPADPGSKAEDDLAAFAAEVAPRIRRALESMGTRSGG